MSRQVEQKFAVNPAVQLATMAVDSRGNTDVESLKRSIVNHLHYTLAKERLTATSRDCYLAVTHTVRDLLVSRWMQTQRHYYDTDARRVYYLSLEFLVGRTLGNAIVNLGLFDSFNQALEELGIDLAPLREEEWDAGLGNGGLGRLAACFLDSMATLGIPAYGYGIRYQYGIFYQKIRNHQQVETPDNWLRYGNPWELARPEYIFPVNFYGKVEQYTDDRGCVRHRWIDTEEVMALAYDTPIPGYENDVVNTMRLWGARSSRGFDLKYFNHGDYIRAVEEKDRTEDISRVLYPNDNLNEGKELRLKQEYFLVSATLQDILRRFKVSHTNIRRLPEKVCIQLNDTHPALAIPELMRILLDQEDLDWDTAWDICSKTFNYTNHTVLPEALETWSLELIERVLPRHLGIIFEINERFLRQVRQSHPHDLGLIQRLSVIQESEPKMIRMANLAVIGSATVNGVSELHTDIIREHVFKDFNDIWPKKIVPMTNGITPRRWLKKANPGLAGLISSYIGEDWVRDLSELKKLVPLVDDTKFRNQWARVKRTNKALLAKSLKEDLGVELNLDSMFTAQAKRIHEYKRQLLNVLYVITQYNRMRQNPQRPNPWVPRTVMISGKAAPGYHMAKLIIELVNRVGDAINRDPAVHGRLQLLFLPNYRVSLAEKLIPATDLSEQISTAGTEASGTGNMKFALNGALTIGTMDGANVEICEEVGRENMFIFGHTAKEIQAFAQQGYNPQEYLQNNHELAQVLEMLENGTFCPEDPERFRPLVYALTEGGDHYRLLADYAPYVAMQEEVDRAFQDQDQWIRKSILNVANMGKFSSDRTIREYADQIWKVTT